MLERVQRRATKFILSDCPTTTYRERLLTFRLFPLMYWLEIQDVMLLVKSLIEPADNTTILNYVTFASVNTQSSSSGKLVDSYTRYSPSRHFYYNRIVRQWNSLPTIDLNQSIYSIKRQIISCLWLHFQTTFIPENVCTYHFLCSCNKCVTLAITR